MISSFAASLTASTLPWTLAIEMISLSCTLVISSMSSALEFRRFSRSRRAASGFSAYSSTITLEIFEALEMISSIPLAWMAQVVLICFSYSSALTSLIASKPSSTCSMTFLERVSSLEGASTVSLSSVKTTPLVVTAIRQARANYLITLFDLLFIETVKRVHFIRTNEREKQ